MMNRKRGLTDSVSCLTMERTPWAPNNLLKPGAKEKDQLNPDGQSNRLETSRDHHRKVQVGKDQEKAQSEKDSHSKNGGGKKLNKQSGTYTMKTDRKPNGHFPIRSHSLT